MKTLHKITSSVLVFLLFNTTEGRSPKSTSSIFDNLYPLYDVHEIKNSPFTSDTLVILSFKNALRSKRNLNGMDDEFLCKIDDSYMRDFKNKYSKNLARHIDMTKMFGYVSGDTTIKAEYYLTGKINKLYGEQHVLNDSYSLFWTIIFAGLIGVITNELVLNMQKTLGKVEIVFSDVKILDKNKNEIASVKRISQVFEGDMPVNRSCSRIYKNVNRHLKIASNKLVDEIGRVFLNYLSKKEKGNKVNSNEEIIIHQIKERPFHSIGLSFSGSDELNYDFKKGLEYSYLPYNKLLPVHGYFVNAELEYLKKNYNFNVGYEFLGNNFFMNRKKPGIFLLWLLIYFVPGVEVGASYHTRHQFGIHTSFFINSYLFVPYVDNNEYLNYSETRYGVKIKLPIGRSYSEFFNSWRYRYEKRDFNLY